MQKVSPLLHVNYFFKGLKEAFNWTHVFNLISSSKVIQKTLLKSLVLNGIAYLGILIILETFYNTPDHHLFGYSYADLTGYPLYLICLIVNSRFYSKFASHQRVNGYDDHVDILTSINTVILYSNFALCITLLKHLIPIIGSILSFFIYCIVMSYYCFEYKWINEQDWTIEQRMNYTEEHWSYFFGFGLPASSIIFFLSTLRAGGVFALIYPCYIMMASVATPEPIYNTNTITSNDLFALPVKIPAFSFVRIMNHCIISIVQKLLVGNHKGTEIFENKKEHFGKLV
ncbi:etoposide-induced protein 2.4-domain-containing protein [Cokeromyces recurvatus]|uniref:etoposide-induced protein 2.4-domain-containing protein n=1 Tax=Cokeromyces recurvatus TaxID=90255 RepID=UPI002220E18A|nr:etoposide-induced protein 2.4-domain-containing protein [Cokeromyces recurvatus]KAI7900604.1 etoposide-induced protein 2.4-domain-containing protein [Cokeromyces recurvatus]